MFLHAIRFHVYMFTHKLRVFVYCCRLGIPLTGLVHDLSKFFPDEWWANVSGNRRVALDLHAGRNRHHRYGDRTGMRDAEYKEMAADIRAASLARGQNPLEWCADHQRLFNSGTLARVLDYLVKLKGARDA